MQPPALLDSATQMVGGSVRAAANTAGGSVRAAANTAGGLAARAAGLLPEGLHFGPRRFRRHAWANAGRGRIEVRGIGADRADGDQTASAITAALRRVRGVRWAEVNAVTGHALVLFDERRVSMATLVDAVAEVEDARDSDAAGWSRAEPPHPDDPAALTAAVTALASDVAGLLVAAVSRLVVVPPLPAGARVAVGIVEAQPRLRRALESGLGPAGTDATVGVGSAVINGLTGGIGPQVVTALHDLLLLREVQGRRAVWRERGCALEETHGALPHSPPVKSPRPTPYPPGPVEVFADRVAAVSLAAAGAVFALTASPARTAKLLLIGVPPAARLGREAFAATLATRLARTGVLPMDPGVFRRLDRVDTVLVDERLLADPPGEADAGAWQAALCDLAGHDDLTVGAAAGMPAAEPAGPITADRIRKLQANGAAVLVVAGNDNDALAAADVAVAVPMNAEPVGWAADLITPPDGAAALTLLQAVPVARRFSRRSVLISSAGTVAAALATALVPWAPGDLTLQPVYLAGLITQLDGIGTAARLARR
jgi:cation-transporting ATPase I